MPRLRFFVICILFIPFLAEELEENETCTASETCERKESAFMTPEEYASKRAVVQGKLDEIVANIASINEQLQDLKKQKDQAVYDEKLIKGELAKLDAMNENLLQSFKKCGATGGLLSLKNFLKKGEKALHVDSVEQLEKMFIAADTNPQDGKVEVHEFISILDSIREQKIVFKGEAPKHIKRKTRSDEALQSIHEKVMDAMITIENKLENDKTKEALEYGKKKLQEIDGCQTDNLEMPCAEFMAEMVSWMYAEGEDEGIKEMLDALTPVLIANDKIGGDVVNEPVQASLMRIWPLLYHERQYRDLAILFEYQHSKEEMHRHDRFHAGLKAAHCRMCNGDLSIALNSYISLRNQVTDRVDVALRWKIERKILRMHRWEGNEKDFSKFLKKVNKKNKKDWTHDYMPGEKFNNKKLQEVLVFPLKKFPQLETIATKLSGEGVFDGWETLMDIKMPYFAEIDIKCGLLDPNSDGDYRLIQMVKDACTFSKKACKYLFKNMKKKENLKKKPAEVNFHVFTGPAKLRPWVGDDERLRLWLRLDQTDQQDCFKITVGGQEKQLQKPLLTNEAYLTSLETTCDGMHGFLEIIFKGKVKKDDETKKWIL